MLVNFSGIKFSPVLAEAGSVSPTESDINCAVGLLIKFYVEGKGKDGLSEMLGSAKDKKEIAKALIKDLKDTQVRNVLLVLKISGPVGNAKSLLYGKMCRIFKGDAVTIKKVIEREMKKKNEEERNYAEIFTDQSRWKPIKPKEIKPKDVSPGLPPGMVDRKATAADKKAAKKKIDAWKSDLIKRVKGPGGIERLAKSAIAVRRSKGDSAEEIKEHEKKYVKPWKDLLYDAVVGLLSSQSGQVETIKDQIDEAKMLGEVEKKVKEVEETYKEAITHIKNSKKWANEVLGIKKTGGGGKVKAKTYKVQKNDTWKSIAKKFAKKDPSGIYANAIKKKNGGAPNPKEGATITIPAEVVAAGKK